MTTTSVNRFQFRRWFVYLFLLGLVWAGYWFTTKPKTAKTDNVNQETAVISYGDIEENVTAQGKLEPKEFVDVGAQVTGQLQKLHVELGDTVSKGELLAEIDPRLYAARVNADEARINTLKAQLLEQEAQILFAGRQYERNKLMYKTHAVSLEALQLSETNIKAARAKLASIKAQLKEVQSTLAGDRTNLGYTKIFAPMDATVVQQSAREGQTLNANQQTPTIMQLAKLDKMTVRSQTAEADIMQIKPGTPAYFTTLGSDQRRWQGVVRQILPTPEVVNNVVLYNVLIDVDNSDGQLMTGMSAQVFFVLGEAKHVLLVPVPALLKRQTKEDNANGKAYLVKFSDADQTIEKTVHVGLQNRRMAEARDGLKEGDKVVLNLPPKKDKNNYPRTPRI